MDKRCSLRAAVLSWLIVPGLCAAQISAQTTNIRQVRVTAERTSVYIEPSRGSTRIDIVGKGTLLNLLQQKKIKEIWFYVSFSSPRYGARISGFVLDSAVEPVGETPAVAPEEKPASAKAKVKPPVPVPPKPEPGKEFRPEPPPAPAIVASIIATSLPQNMPIPLPRKISPLQEPVWPTPEKTPTQKKPVEVKPIPPEPPRISEIIIPTSLPGGKKYAIPRRAAPLLEPPWKVEKAAPVVIEKPVPPVVQKSEPAPPPVEKKKAEPREVPAPKPTPKEKEVEKPEPEEKPAPPQIIKPARILVSRKGPGGVSIGLGYGSSFGGAGACLQISTGGGIAVHAGAGIFPTTLIYSETDWVNNETLWSVGLKYYLPVKSPLLYPFVDVQYGGLRVEAAQAVIGIWDYDYVISREQKSLYGPSFLSGVEVRKGRFGLCGAMGVSYVTTSWKYLETKVLFSFDASLVVHF
ncbi:MAG: hypothetical protein JXE07_04815 [Candidatus Aminicenantes bacterium]|nr:hypothetical protein [Candidatus Aminicenantes bacterium]